MAALEAEADNLEQYTRHPDLRFHGIDEEGGEDQCFCGYSDGAEVGTVTHRSQPAGAQSQDQAGAL